MNSDGRRPRPVFRGLASSTCAIVYGVLYRLPAIAVILAICLVLLVGAPASAQCHPPHFRTGQDYGASLFISVERRDFTLDKLTCLAQALRDRHPDWKTFGVIFFDSYEAAQYFHGQQVEDIYPKWPEWAKEVHAMYSFDADKHEESLEIWPVGFTSAPSLDTTVNLPLAGARHCRLEIQNRCLMAAMEKITYPQGAPPTRASGTVALVGLIRRDGRVTGLRVAEVDVRPAQEKGRLANAALNDLETWQFDAGGHDDPIRIVYSFAIDAALPRGVAPEVRWVSPNEVEVRANPPE